MVCPATSFLLQMNNGIAQLLSFAVACIPMIASRASLGPRMLGGSEARQLR
jgi:hypothetical protein